MRFVKRAILALLILVLVIAGLSAYLTWHNQQRDHHTLSFGKCHYPWILKRASEKRLAFEDYYMKEIDSGWMPAEAEPYFESSMDLELEAQASQEPLPLELEMFDKFQHIRRAGYAPVWKDYRYILKDEKSGDEIDPFIRADGRAGSSGLSRFPDLRSKLGDVLFGDIYGIRDPDFVRLEAHLYHYKLYNARVVLRDNEYVFADTTREADYPISFEGILLRNKAAIYNLSFSIPHVHSEAVLRDHGIIMRRKNGQYHPEYLEGERKPELPAKPVVITRALRVLNQEAERHGKDFLTPEGYEKIRYVMEGAPGYMGLMAKELLELYGVKFRWNEANQQYEIAADE